MNTAYINTDPALILEGIAAGTDRRPQHTAHIRAFRAEQWDRILAATNERVTRALTERRAREDAGIW